MLRRLFYVSVISPGTTIVDVEAIVSASIIWNRRNDVTGLLVASGWNFSQVLEGRAEAISRVLARIRSDGHHHSISVLIDQPITQRLFSRWSMAFLKRDDLADDLRRLHEFADRPLRDAVLEELARACRELAHDL